MRGIILLFQLATVALTALLPYLCVAYAAHLLF